MAVKLNAELDEYFNTGDQPSESNFQDLIDSILPTPVEITDTASPTITKAANQGRVNIVPMIGQATTITLPTPAAAGEWYKFVSAFTGNEDDNVIFSTGSGNSVFMKGQIALIDTDGNSSADFSDGDSNETLTLEDPDGFEINFLSKSATEWYVWGWCVSADTAAFAD